MNEEHDIYLASASPRRRELLEQIGVRYRLLQVDVPEVPQPGEVPEMYVLRVALEKARAGRACVAAGDSRPVLGADTEVVIDGAVLGKPSGREDALSMLARLCGREHQVMSAVALVGAEGEEQSRLCVSTVQFRSVSREEAEAYWESGEPQGKAGGYAVQGRGALFIARLDGSYSGVMGLPLFETGALLEQVGIVPLARGV
jgi:septum formation protein